MGNVLTSAQISSYHDNGYLLAEGLFSPQEAAEFRRESHDLAARWSARYPFNATWDSANEAFGRNKLTHLFHCEDVQFHSAVFSRLIVDERLTGAAADLIGSPNVQLHHTK